MLLIIPRRGDPLLEEGKTRGQEDEGESTLEAEETLLPNFWISNGSASRVAGDKLNSRRDRERERRRGRLRIQVYNFFCNYECVFLNET